MIDNTKNFDDIFFRMIGVSLCKTLTHSILWINHFKDYKRRVVVPFYLSLAGNERYVYDAFVDDIVDSRIELNVSQIPRGIITLNSFNTSNEEFANPNEYLTKKVVINEKLRSIISKTKAIPIKLNYDVEISVDSEIDAYKCSEKIINLFFNYMFFNIDYYGIKIDAFFELPDDKDVTIPREINLDSDSKKTIKFSLKVHTYYPSFFDDTDNLEVCDNDNEIDWDKLGIKRPLLTDSNFSGVKKVIWENYLWNLKDKTHIKDETKRQFPNKDFPKENL